MAADEQLAECVNSGNSTEPHVHVQLMDRAQPAFATGLPFRFTGTDAPDGLPKSEQPS